MSNDCDDDKVSRQLPTFTTTADDAGGTDDEAAVLVKRYGDTAKLSARETRDVHSAITHGLASYLLQLDRSQAGRSCRLTSAIADYPDREDGARALPSAAVYTNELGVYEDAGMKPGAPEILDPSDPQKVLTISEVATYTLSDLRVEVVCEDKVQREGVRRMLEDGCNPVQWMGGFRLILPAYHNADAEFTLIGARFLDDIMAPTGPRALQLQLTARCPQYRLYHLPLAKPQTRGSIVQRGR